jgi:Domain of unknown function (DUF1996).
MKRGTRLTTVAVGAIVALVVAANPAWAAPAGIFTSSFADGPRRVDPIVSPGEQSDHEHCFYGVRGVTNTETSASLRMKPSTWAVGDVDHSVFWIPCVYEDGRLLPPATRYHFIAYYQSVAGTEQVPPENTAGVSTEMGYRCDIGGGVVTDLPPTTCSGTTLVLSGMMRGERDLHLTEPFPKIRVFVRLDRGHSGRLGQITVGGPAIGVDGEMGPDTVHFDYIWAWDREVFRQFLANCVRPDIPCGTNPRTQTFSSGT